jgi:ABC-type transport system involved in cytochrome bd biosynthesis fused ATPase/permease subunit
MLPNMNGLQQNGRSSVSVEMHSVEAGNGQSVKSSKDSVELIFRELGYSVKVEKPSTKKSLLASFSAADFQSKEILKRVTGIIRPQRLTCILGASGAGKTSLLNILSGSLVSGSLSGQLVRAGAF